MKINVFFIFGWSNYMKKVNWDKYYKNNIEKCGGLHLTVNTKPLSHIIFINLIWQYKVYEGSTLEKNEEICMNEISTTIQHEFLHALIYDVVGNKKGNDERIIEKIIPKRIYYL